MFLPALSGIGPVEVLILSIVCIPIFFSFLSHTRVMVVSGKIINPRGVLLIRIQGRRAGFIHWLLKLCRIEAAITFSVYKDRIELREDSFFGERTDFIFLKNVSVLGISYASSPLLLVLAVVLFFLGTVVFFMGEETWPSLIFLFFAAVSLGGYVLSKRYGIQIRSPGLTWQILFYRSLIEGTEITPYDLERIQQIFRFLMDSEGYEDNSEEIAAPTRLQEPAVIGEISAIETKGAAQRVFSPAPPSQPSASAQQSIPTPPLPTSRRPVQPPEPPRLR